MGSAILGYLAVSLITGFICYSFAKDKGYDSTKWFVAGFFGSIIACAIIMSIDKKVQEKKAEKRKM